jgi:signal transduction histidine kinase
MATFAEYISQHVDAIVDDFEAFARTSGPAAEHLRSKELRDHAKIVLEAVAADMATPQSESAQDDKSKGQAKNSQFSQVMKTSRQHAQHRFQQGFTLPQMLSEYRALRTAVIRRWTEQLDGAGAEQLAELTRFGEAIDEGLTEAIAWYSQRLEDSRNMLVGIFAHDLRGPLGAVRLSAEYLQASDRLQDGELRAVTRIASSSARMAGYVDDLLDFTHTLLGGGLPISRKPVDLACWCEDVVDEIRAAHPAAEVHLEVLGSTSGQWDPIRLSQLLSNLVTNAIIHGDPHQPVTVRLSTTVGGASIDVHNHGDAIAVSDLPTLFRPLMREPQDQKRRRGSSGLGLGLYITREIAVAHGGSVEVTSEAGAGTTFKVCLPLE